MFFFLISLILKAGNNSLKNTDSDCSEGSSGLEQTYKTGITAEPLTDVSRSRLWAVHTLE